MRWTKYQKDACNGYVPFWAENNFKKDYRMPDFKEKKKELGFYPFEIWNLDAEIVSFILPRLKYYKDHSNGHPYNISKEEWDIKLDKYIHAFQTYLTSEDSTERKNIMTTLHEFIDDINCLWT